MSLVHSVVETPVGKLLLAASPRGLVLCEFEKRGSAKESLARLPEREGDGGPGDEAAAVRHLKQAAEEMKAYFRGRLKKFAVPFDLRGGDFEVRVWKALLNIPYGQTRTYGEIARRVGKPGAARAVGRANNRNPIAIAVPCHRVLGADGGLVGYGGGLETKRILLEHEGVLVPLT